MSLGSQLLNETSPFGQRCVWSGHLRTLGHFETFWDNLEDFLTSLEHLNCFQSFPTISPVIGSLENKSIRTMMRLKLKFWDIWGILRHLGHFGTNSEDILTSSEHLDCFPSHFGPFSPVISSFKKKRVTDGRTDRPPYRDAWTHLKTETTTQSHRDKDAPFCLIELVLF